MIDDPDASDKEELHHMQSSVDEIIEAFARLKQLTSCYDEKLNVVIERHEDDFKAAYRAHMSKVEKQLQVLKHKAKD